MGIDEVKEMLKKALDLTEYDETETEASSYINNK